MRPFTPEAMQQQRPSGYNLTLSKNSSWVQLQPLHVQHTSILEADVDVVPSADSTWLVPMNFKTDKVQRVVERALSR